MNKNTIEKKQDILLSEQKNYKQNSLEEFKLSKISVIGCGGVGSQVAELLIRSGIKNLILIDNDIVEIDNLGRQNFEIEDISISKVEALQKRLKKISKESNIITHFDIVTTENISKYCNDSNIIVDCTDNLDSRRIINTFSLKNSKLWIYSGGQGFESIVSTFDYSKINEDTFSKLINPNHSQEVTCQDGVLNTTTTITACLIINELLKYLCLEKNSNVIKFNSLHNSFLDFKLK